MKRIALALSLAAALCLTASPVLAQAAADVQIRHVDLQAFPEITLTLSLPRGADASDVSVTEEGIALNELKIQSLEQAGRTVDVVLAIDTSGSMVGAPLASAVEAARTFLGDLPDNVRVGIVTFSDTASVAVPPTSQHDRALRALNNLVAVGETALYDGVAEAASLLKGTGQRNIVLLSDGADTVSTASLRDALGEVRSARAAVYSVALESGDFDASSLQRLSRASKGRYATAATADLADLYQGLASEFSNQYLVSYTSESPDNTQIEITVQARSSADSTLVLTPDAPAPVPDFAPKPAPEAEPLLEGTVGFAITIGLVFMALFVLFVMLIGGSARRKREQDLAQRIAPPSIEMEQEEDRGAIEWIPDSIVDLGERASHVGGFAAKSDVKLERAGVAISPGEFAAAILVSAVAAGILGGLLIGKVWFAVVAALAGGAIPWLVLSFAAGRRMKTLHGQLADILMILASSLRAGHSFLQAIDAVAQEVGEPGAREFNRLVAEIRLGRPVDEALFALGERIDSEDFKWAVLAVNIQREVGGNLAEVLDTVADTIRERENIRRQIDVLSAEGRLSIYVLAGLPFLLALYMAIVNPDYLGLLFTTRIGLVMVVVAGCLLGLGIYWMRKVVKIVV